MSPKEIAQLRDEQIMELVVSVASSGKADELARDDVFAAVCEIRKRRARVDVPRTPSGRVRNANSVEIDPERWRAAWYRRRISQSALNEMLGKSKTWSVMIAKKACCNFFVLDQIAAELGETTDDLVWEVASDRERQRLSFA